MRVLHIPRTVTPDGGGVQTYLASTAAALENTPTQLSIGAPWPGVRPRFRCQLLHLGDPKLGNLHNLLRYFAWLKRDIKQFDVVHIHNIFGFHLVAAALVCKYFHVPYLVSPHGRLVPESLRTMPLKLKVYLYLISLPLLRRAAGIVVTTQGNADSIHQFDDRLRCFVVCPGLVRSSTIRYQPRNDGILRIAFVGRLEPVKGVPTLLQAISHLISRGIDAHTEIIGWSDDSYQLQLRELAKKLGIADKVAFRGMVRGEEKDRIIASAHVVAVPSERENFSFVTAEALSLGVPVVVSSTVGLAHVVRKYGCGNIVPPGDASAWAEALLAFSSPEKCRSASDGARRCAREEFSIEAMQRALIYAYEAAIETKANTR